MMARDQGRAVRSVLVVKGHGMDRAGTKSVDGGPRGRTEVQSNVMVTNATKQFRCVHGGTVFIVAADGEGVGSFPAVRLRA